MKIRELLVLMPLFSAACAEVKDSKPKESAVMILIDPSGASECVIRINAIVVEPGPTQIGEAKHNLEYLAANQDMAALIVSPLAPTECAKELRQLVTDTGFRRLVANQ